jgi:hypothetical protein
VQLSLCQHTGRHLKSAYDGCKPLSGAHAQHKKLFVAAALQAYAAHQCGFAADSWWLCLFMHVIGCLSAAAVA